MSQITQVISEITDPPDTNDPANFDARADQLFNIELPQLVTELNVFRTQANALSTDANLDAASALDSKNVALQAKTDSQNFAVQLGSAVTGFPNQYSSREWAVGAFVPDGSSKEWATLFGASVVTGEYSAKEWAIGNFVPDGSAKFWADVSVGATNYVGPYSAIQTYSIGQIVDFGNSLYVSRTNGNLGNTPTDKTFWLRIGGVDEGKQLFFGSL